MGVTLFSLVAFIGIAQQICVDERATLERLDKTPGRLLTFDATIPGNPLVRASFVLADIKASDFPDLGGLRNLKHVGFHASKVSGDILARLSKSQSLESLHLQGVEVNDGQLASLQSLKLLKSLVLTDACVSDEGVKYFAHLKGLEVVGLSGTQISAVGVSRLSRLSKLQDLNLSRTKISDDACRTLSRFSHLRKLDLSSTAISDKGFLDLEPVLAQLECLSIVQTRLSGDSWPRITLLKRVKKLSVGGRFVDNKFLESAGTLASLQELDINEARTCDAGIGHLMKATKLTSLSIWNADLTDEGLMLLVHHKGITLISLIGTRVTKSGVERFRSVRPGVFIEHY
ncbi:MAG TPA: hypothetical protein VFE62_22545 [Gemmataceae bacterium]|nr:hypothetical protein [Gemmataceae bacterium]